MPAAEEASETFGQLNPMLMLHRHDHEADKCFKATVGWYVFWRFVKAAKKPTPHFNVLALDCILSRMFLVATLHSNQQRPRGLQSFFSTAVGARVDTLDTTKLAKLADTWLRLMGSLTSPRIFCQRCAIGVEPFVVCLLFCLSPAWLVRAHMQSSRRIDVSV